MIPLDRRLRLAKGGQSGGETSKQKSRKGAAKRSAENVTSDLPAFPAKNVGSCHPTAAVARFALIALNLKRPRAPAVAISG